MLLIATLLWLTLTLWVLPARVQGDEAKRVVRIDTNIPADIYLFAEGEVEPIRRTYTPQVFDLAPGAYRVQVGRMGYFSQAHSFVVEDKDLIFYLQLDRDPKWTLLTESAAATDGWINLALHSGQNDMIYFIPREFFSLFTWSDESYGAFSLTDMMTSNIYDPNSHSLQQIPTTLNTVIPSFLKSVADIDPLIGLSNIAISPSERYIVFPHYNEALPETTLWIADTQTEDFCVSFGIFFYLEVPYHLIAITRCVRYRILN